MRFSSAAFKSAKVWISISAAFSSLAMYAMKSGFSMLTALSGRHAGSTFVLKDLSASSFW